MPDREDRPLGRPSKYDPAYCDAAIEHMGTGLSIAGLAGKLRVSRQTIYQWAEDYPDFSDALNEARAASALWWEERALEMASGKAEGAPAMVIFGLKNRVADEWREKITHASDPEQPLMPMVIQLVAPRHDDGAD